MENQKHGIIILRLVKGNPPVEEPGLAQWLNVSSLILLGFDLNRVWSRPS